MCFAELGEQESIQQGIKRFSVRNRATPPGWLNEPATPPGWLNEPATPLGWLKFKQSTGQPQEQTGCFSRCRRLFFPLRNSPSVNMLLIPGQVPCYAQQGFSGKLF